MENLEDANEKAFEWLSRLIAILIVVNNLSEVFNNYKINYRDKPIKTMMECVRPRLLPWTCNESLKRMDAS